MQLSRCRIYDAEAVHILYIENISVLENRQALFKEDFIKIQKTSESEFSSIND